MLLSFCLSLRYLSLFYYFFKDGYYSSVIDYLFEKFTEKHYPLNSELVSVGVWLYSLNG